MHLDGLQRVGAMNLAEIYLEQTKRDERLQAMDIPVVNGTHYIIGSAFYEHLYHALLDALCAGSRCIDITLHDRASETISHFLRHRDRFERSGHIPAPPETFPVIDEALELDLHRDPFLDPVDLGKLVDLLLDGDGPIQETMAEIAFDRIHRRILNHVRRGHLAFHLVVPRQVLYLMRIYRQYAELCAQ